MDKIMTDKENLTNPNEILESALQYIKNNQLDLALNILNEGQAKFPREFTFINLLAQIALRNKNIQAGISLLKKSLIINPKQPLVAFDLGIALSINNQLDEAILFFDKSIELDPKNLKVLMRKALTLNQLHKFNESIDCYKKIIELNPNIIEAYTNQAESLNSIGKTEQSLYLYQKAVEIEPTNARLFIKYGNLFDKLGRVDEALNAYRKSLKLKSDNAGALINIGYLLIKLRKFDEAIIYLKNSIEIRPDYEVYHNIGAAYFALDNSLDGIIYYDKAIKLKPDYAEAHLLKAHALQRLGLIDQAILSYNHALENNKDFKYVFSELLYAQQSICDWSNFKNNINWLGLRLKENKKIAVPLALYYFFDEPAIHKISAEIYANDLYPANDSLGPISQNPKNKKIRIGYFSGDFREHPVGHLVAELFEMHDVSKFELFAFSISNRIESKARSRIEKSVDEFIDVASYSDKDVALLAREKKIDIAIDLGGYTKNGRPSIFAMRVAPIQINFLGYPGTMGTNYIDYIISDKFIISKELQKNYSEKIIYLPRCSQPIDQSVTPGKKIFTRESEGLPKKGFIFCCFNSCFKITPNIFQIWVNLLSAIDNSILWFPGFSALAIKNLRKECVKLGIDDSRLIFSSLEEHKSDYLTKIKLADIFLDSYPFGGHSTVSDFLKAGVPIVTLRGRSIPNQVASSFLSNLNLPELITASEKEYENLAMKLASDPKYLKEIKKKLTLNVSSSFIYDINKYTLSLESGYIQIYDRYHNKLNPDNIDAQ